MKFQKALFSMFFISQIGRPYTIFHPKTAYLIIIEENLIFLTCVSDKLRCLASSLRSAPTTYWFFSKACSNFNSWLGLKAVRILFGLRKGSKNSGKWGPEIKKNPRIKKRCWQVQETYCYLFLKSLCFVFESFSRTKEHLQRFQT